MLAKVLRGVLMVIRSVGYWLLALWLFSVYGLVGDIEGFERARQLLNGRRRD